MYLIASPLTKLAYSLRATVWAHASGSDRCHRRWRCTAVRDVFVKMERGVRGAVNFHSIVVDFS